jgi:hypothetical protein
MVFSIPPTASARRDHLVAHQRFIQHGVTPCTEDKHEPMLGRGNGRGDANIALVDFPDRHRVALALQLYEVAPKGAPICPQTVLSDTRREIVVEPLLPGAWQGAETDRSGYVIDPPSPAHDSSGGGQTAAQQPHHARQFRNERPLHAVTTVSALIASLDVAAITCRPDLAA